MNRPAFLLAAALVFPMLATAAPKADVDAGKAKAAVCQACHGIDGNGIGDPQYPLLAGQYADYLEKALHDYRSGTRDNPIMAGFASTLSDEDIVNLAAYFASQQTHLLDLQNVD